MLLTLKKALKLSQQTRVAADEENAFPAGFHVPTSIGRTPDNHRHRWSSSIFGILAERSLDNFMIEVYCFYGFC
jgi:hypothetical protein